MVALDEKSSTAKARGLTYYWKTTTTTTTTNTKSAMSKLKCDTIRWTQGVFPDAVTARGLKHLLELERMVASGHRAVLFFLVNRPDADSMSIAKDIDPQYSNALTEVTKSGVEVLAYQVDSNLNRMIVVEKYRLNIDKKGFVMSRITLHHYWRSSCSWRVRWALELKNIPYKSVSVNLLSGEHKSASYLKKSKWSSSLHGNRR